ncbi:MAG: plastocyanin/azurin family copper-binding protein [Nitrosopumilus sp.]
MKKTSMKISILAGMFSILLISTSVSFADSASIPEWIKNNALWYGQGTISETEFLNAMKFLIENDVLVIDTKDTEIAKIPEAVIEIPSANSDVGSTGFYVPLNLEIPKGTQVTWVNSDSVSHNIQSLDESGSVADWFNSPPLNTGDRFEFTFEDDGVYHYYCSFHPWRIGLVTVK